MIIYPANDLYNGQCVRLYQGSYQKKTVYSDDPFATIKQFANDNSKWLHIVDLNGAKDPGCAQISLIKNLINEVDINIQMGGGIRSKKQVENLLQNGVQRIIVGSLAVKNPTEVKEWMSNFGNEHIVLALDVKINEKQQPIVNINGWQKSSGATIDELINIFQSTGLKHLLCTDISRDGTLNEPNYALYKKLVEQYPLLNIQASGGIQSINDLKELKQLKVAGAVVGKALYENKFTLSEALAC